MFHSAKRFGIWVISAESLAELRRRGYAKVEPSDQHILLNADGTCRFKSYWEYSAPPDGVNSLEHYVTEADACSWQPVSADVQRWSRRNVIGAIDIDVTRSNKGHRTFTAITLELERRDGQHVLSAVIDDADRGHTVDYVRAPR